MTTTTDVSRTVPVLAAPDRAALGQLARRRSSCSSSAWRSRSRCCRRHTPSGRRRRSAALFAATLIVNAWGRYTGGLLVTPALALLFLMNVFPLLWSFGLSFFTYRANRARAPTWVGLENYANVLSDPDIWDRLHNTVIIVIMTVTTQMVVGFLLALLFSKQFPLRRYLMILVLTPMMLSFVAVGAFFRYYYDPTFGLLSQAVRAVHRPAVHSDEHGVGLAHRHRLRRRLDVVALRDAARARGARQRAEISLRGRGDRPRPALAAVLVDHLPLYPRPDAARAAVPHDRGVQAVRSRLPAHATAARAPRPRPLRCASIASPSKTTRRANRPRSPISCCSP